MSKNSDDVFEQACNALSKSVPTTRRNTLVRSDLKRDDCMFDSADPDRVITILDWDMTTIGDLLFVLGTLLSYWRETGDAADRSPTFERDTASFPSWASLV